MSAPGLVVFGEDWGAHPSSTQHIVSRLAQDRDVLWINSIGLRRPRLTRADAQRLMRKLAQMGGTRTAPAHGAPPPERLRILAPRALPWPGSRLAACVNRAVLAPQIRREMARMGMERPLLWASLPTAVDLADALPHRALVYYCGDDFSALAGVDHAPVARLERRLTERADLILAASEPLAARFPAERTRLAPHGVDFDLFATPAPRAPDLPQARGIAGFYGALAPWIDIDMLAGAARALPDWLFVFVGPLQCDEAPLAALPNVRLLGPRPHAALPSYAQHWSVSMLPFRDNAQIRACNPLKLREYLAAGAPVAATPFPALAPYAELIHLAARPADFARTLQEAACDEARASARRARVAAESWDARAQEIATALDALA